MPIRVLQVVTVMNRGGLETMLMNYYRQTDRGQIQFDFMVHRMERGHYDDEIEALGGRIYRMPHIRPGHYRSYFGKLDDFFKAHPEYRVVHAHINENSSFVLGAAHRAGIPCRIAHSHLSDLGIDIKLPFRLYARMAMKDHPTRYFACSRNAGTWLFGKEREVTVLNNAVDAKEFKRDEAVRSAVREELGLVGKRVIGHIGRFNKQKNHEFLIEIMNAAVKQDPNVILLLVGEGHLRQSIEDKVSNLGIGDHVRFLGMREDIPRLLQSFDLFLFPSLFEGLPVVLIEAQAAGLNCLISDTITQECNITGRVTFADLKQPARHWASLLSNMSTEYADTSALLSSRGYDTATMAAWLGNVYLEESREPVHS
ncbi:glycosyltransferase family 1 protein [Paenibacillus swuensis]|uniref:glycosyltransferase family 1 protein n=1 Tax=Paenibacillus swuensis TaxID=1178515 RepID=UPI000A56F98D|nr:glycosyltransferase family 1 protein [Paenibacillus swuensis]